MLHINTVTCKLNPKQVLAIIEWLCHSFCVLSQSNKCRSHILWLEVNKMYGWNSKHDNHHPMTTCLQQTQFKINPRNTIKVILKI